MKKILFPLLLFFLIGCGKDLDVTHHAARVLATQGYTNIQADETYNGGLCGTDNNPQEDDFIVTNPSGVTSHVAVCKEYGKGYTIRFP